MIYSQLQNHRTANHRVLLNRILCVCSIIGNSGENRDTVKQRERTTMEEPPGPRRRQQTNSARRLPDPRKNGPPGHTGN